jgi:hypothetical protein
MLTSRRVVLPLLCLMGSLLAGPLSSPSSAADGP